MISNNSSYLLYSSYLHAKNIIHRDMKSNSIFYHLVHFTSSYFCNFGYDAKSILFLKHVAVCIDMNILLLAS